MPAATPRRRVLSARVRCARGRWAALAAVVALAAATPAIAAELSDEVAAPSPVACPVGGEGHRRANDAAEHMRRSGDHAEAFACYHEALATKPGFAPSLYGLGVLALDMRRFEAARGFLEAAVSAWPEYADAWSALGEAYASAGEPNYRIALSKFKKAVDLKADDALSWEALGSHQAAFGHLEEAVETYLEATERAPGSPGLRYSLANVYRRMGKYDECVDEATTAYSMAPGFGMAQHTAGACLWDLGQQGPALQLLIRAANVEPDVLEHHTTLVSKLLESNGDISRACDDLRVHFANVEVQGCPTRASPSSESHVDL